MAKKSKNSAKKSKSTGTKHIHVGKKRLEQIKKAAHKAGLADHVKKALGKTKETVFIQIDRKKFDKLKELAKKEPKLLPHLADCDCDPDDPFCICL